MYRLKGGSLDADSATSGLPVPGADSLSGEITVVTPGSTLQTAPRTVSVLPVLRRRFGGSRARHSARRSRRTGFSRMGRKLLLTLALGVLRRRRGRQYGLASGGLRRSSKAGVSVNLPGGQTCHRSHASRMLQPQRRRRRRPHRHAGPGLLRARSTTTSPAQRPGRTGATVDGTTGATGPTGPDRHHRARRPHRPHRHPPAPPARPAAAAPRGPGGHGGSGGRARAITATAATATATTSTTTAASRPPTRSPKPPPPGKSERRPDQVEPDA